MKARPITTHPKGRFVLIKHKAYGWIEAMFDEEVYKQSLDTHGPGAGGFAWSNPTLDCWLYHCDVIAWAELPEEQ